MSLDEYELAKAIAIQTQQQKAQLEDSTTPAILQDLMIDDPELRRILKGEMQEPLEELRDLVIDCTKQKAIRVEDAVKIMGLLRTINQRLLRYQRLKPFMMLLSPLIGLTYLTPQQAEQWERRVSIMIRREILDMNEEDLEIDDLNFWEALKLVIYVKITDSVDGWKMRSVTEQKKIVETRFPDQQRKKRFWLF